MLTMSAYALRSNMTRPSARAASDPSVSARSAGRAMAVATEVSVFPPRWSVAPSSISSATRCRKSSSSSRTRRWNCACMRVSTVRAPPAFVEAPTPITDLEADLSVLHDLAPDSPHHFFSAAPTSFGKRVSTRLRPRFAARRCRYGQRGHLDRRSHPRAHDVHPRALRPSIRPTNTHSKRGVVCARISPTS